MVRHTLPNDRRLESDGPRTPVSDPNGLRIFRGRPRLRLALLSAVVAILGGWLGNELVRTHVQGVVVRKIWDLGGYVGRRSEAPEVRIRTPRWYRNILGRNFMDPVVMVRLAGTKVSDEDLSHLGKLRQLRMLDLHDTQITGSGLRRLHGLSHLEVLILSGTAVSGEFLSEMKKMPQLKLLCLEETKITDEGLRQLASLPNLGWLNLSGTPMTDAGLLQLSKCPGLEVLILEGCSVTTGGLNELCKVLPRVDVYDGSRGRPWFQEFYAKHLL